jgi:hypothetical protein
MPRRTRSDFQPTVRRLARSTLALQRAACFPPSVRKWTLHPDSTHQERNAGLMGAKVKGDEQPCAITRQFRSDHSARGRRTTLATSLEIACVRGMQRDHCRHTPVGHDLHSVPNTPDHPSHAQRHGASSASQANLVARAADVRTRPSPRGIPPQTSHS